MGGGARGGGGEARRDVLVRESCYQNTDPNTAAKAYTSNIQICIFNTIYLPLQTYVNSIYIHNILSAKK